MTQLAPDFAREMDRRFAERVHRGMSQIAWTQLAVAVMFEVASEAIETAIAPKDPTDHDWMMSAKKGGK